LLIIGALSLNSETVFRFFPAHQVPEIILNKSSKITENAFIEWFRKATTRYFMKTNVNVVPFVLSLVFKTIFGNFLASLVCQKSVK
jgi:hypothetical protein